jgi:uncharacterized protein (DUF1697 family)
MRVTIRELEMPKRNAEVYVALFRGVNVGGNNKLPMKDLAEIFTKVGCNYVKTYIQSGNVIFTAPNGLSEGFPDKVAALVEKRFGHRPSMTLRSLGEMAEVVRHNPYQKAGMDGTQIAVLFLADTPSKDKVGKLDLNRSPGDQFTVRGSEIYVQV